MSAHNRLERQLRASVAQRADRRLGFGRGPRSRWRLGLPELIVAASAAVVLAVAAVALVSLRHGRSPSSHPPAAAQPHDGSRLGPPPKPPLRPARNVDSGAIDGAANTAWRDHQACYPAPNTVNRGPMVSNGTPSAGTLSTLPVLRRPATAADHLPDTRSVHNWMRDFHVAFYVRFVRLARVADGVTFYVVPAARVGISPLPPAAADRCYQLAVAALKANLPTIPKAKRAATLRYGEAEFAFDRYRLETSRLHEGVFLLAGDEPEGGQSPLAIRQKGMFGAARLRPGGPEIIDGIVPAGVASVTLHFPASPHSSQRLPALDLAANVVNNVFVVPAPNGTFVQRPGPNSETWHSASGKTIKTVPEP